MSRTNLHGPKVVRVTEVWLYAVNAKTLKLIFSPGPAEYRYAHVFANSVDPDQLASEETNWYESTLFVIK